MNIVWFGQHRWDDSWSARQQIVSRLARRGHRVLYVNPDPSGSAPGVAQALASWRNRCSVQPVQDGLHVLTRRPLTGPAAKWLDLRTLGATAERLGLWAPVVVCQSPSQRGLIQAVNPAASIYFAPEARPAPGNQAEETEEQALLRECDVALAGSTQLLERFSRIQPRSFLQQDGVDLEQFRPAALEGVESVGALALLPRPRLGYVGQLDDSLDQDLLIRLARRFPAATVVLAGRMTRPEAMALVREEPNVYLLANLEARQLGGIYRELDVGLIPCGPTDGSPPAAARIFEYLAADLPTVSTATAGL